MPNTFTKIASVTVGAGGASSIDFTSIPSTYTDLCIKISGRCTLADANFSSVLMEFNGSSANKSNRFIYGNGSSAISGTDTNLASVLSAGNALTTSSTFGNAEIYIPNYAGSSNKSSSADGVAEANATTATMALTANLWSNTAAVTSIRLYFNSGNFAQYSTAVLYGIKNS